MADSMIQQQLQEARRALRVCTGERDRSREEARQLRAQLRALRAELQAVRPVEQVELLAAQQGMREAREEAQQAKAQAADSEAARAEAEHAREKALVQAKQARMESDMSLERVIELREQLTRLRANQSINASAVAVLRAQLDAVRQEAELPPEAPPAVSQAPPPGDSERLSTRPEPMASLADPPEAPGVPESAPEPAPEPEAEEDALTPNTDFDLPEGAIWEFEGVAEPELFMPLCVELCARAAGDYLRIGHFEGQVEGRDWALVVMAGPEHSVRDFLVALERENMRLMSATGLPLVRIQPTRWSANVLDAHYEQVSPTRYARIQAMVVSGALRRQEGGQ